MATAQKVIGTATWIAVLVQAFIAGDHLFKAGAIDIHGYIANGVFTLVVVSLLLAFLTKEPKVQIGLAIALVALVSAQMGLGYSGRDSLDAASWHVPNGVLIFGIATLRAATSWGFRLTTSVNTNEGARS